MNILWAFVLTIQLGGHTITQKTWNMASLNNCNTVRIGVEERWKWLNEENQGLHQPHGASVGPCVDQSTLKQDIMTNGVVSSPRLEPGTQTPGQ